MDAYFATLTLFGLAIFGAAWIPRLVERQPLSIPILYVGIGAAIYLLPLEIAPADPTTYGGLAEHLTEIGVIMALTGAGLKLERPIAGVLALSGTDLTGPERGVMGFFGIRGIGSFFYLAHGLNEADFAEGSLLWATAGFVVLVSVVVHGITAGPAVNWMESMGWE